MKLATSRALSSVFVDVTWILLLCLADSWSYSQIYHAIVLAALFQTFPQSSLNACKNNRKAAKTKPGNLHYYPE